MPDLLVVDDEENVLYSMQTSLAEDGLTIRTAQTARQALAMIEQQRPDAIILDVRLPDMSGLDAFDRIRQLENHIPVIVITAFAATETAIEAMKRGAFEYLLKPVDLHQLREILGRAFQLSRFRHVPAVFVEPESAEGPVDVIVGKSLPMQAVYKAIGRVAPQDVPVLILGESGTGKELVARAIYHHSRRHNLPFLAINCAAIPETLLESELFGHERGSFTGADRERIGKFEQAHQGTLFLDEIGDMTPATQAKVLRLLQEQRFERIGGNRTIQTDVRIIAATNQNLEAMVAAGRFRQDLLYRLNGFTISIPPLRDRVDDLPLLIDHFLRMGNRSLGKNVRTVSPEAMERLHRHDWPGNVRELQSVIRYALVQSVGDAIMLESLPEQFFHSPGGDVQTVRDDVFDLKAFLRKQLEAGERDLYRQVIQMVDQTILEMVLAYVKGNQVQASEILGISRTTLRAKLQSLGLRLEKQILSES